MKQQVIEKQKAQIEWEMATSKSRLNDYHRTRGVIDKVLKFEEKKLRQLEMYLSDSPGGFR